MNYYFAQINDQGDVVRTFVDLQREYPEFKFSKPEKPSELAALQDKIVRVYRTPSPALSWPMTIKSFGVKNVGGVYKEVYELVEITDPEMIAKHNSYAAHAQDPNTPIITTAQISKDATFF